MLTSTLLWTINYNSNFSPSFQHEKPQGSHRWTTPNKQTKKRFVSASLSSLLADAYDETGLRALHHLFHLGIALGAHWSGSAKQKPKQREWGAWGFCCRFFFGFWPRFTESCMFFVLYGFGFVKIMAPRAWRLWVTTCCRYGSRKRRKMKRQRGTLGGAGVSLFFDGKDVGRWDFVLWYKGLLGDGGILLCWRAWALVWQGVVLKAALKAAPCGENEENPTLKKKISTPWRLRTVMHTSWFI